jgi:hypothetical protein
MASLRSRLAGLGGATALLASLFLANPAASLAAGAPHPYTCTGGSIAKGTYSSLTVAGVCTLDKGSVKVTGNVEVTGGAALIALFGGSNLTVGGDLVVDKDGALGLGCEPFAATCINDNQAHPKKSTNDSVAGDLVAHGALAVIVHHTWVGGDVRQSGGGGGVNCDSRAVLMGSPAYATYEDVTVAGSVSITGFRSCWLGFFRNTVTHDVTFDNNVVADPDGNEVATNTIGGDLRCKGNNPAAQVGDSGGAPNDVGGHASGQCKGLTT